MFASPMKLLAIRVLPFLALFFFSCGSESPVPDEMVQDTVISPEYTDTTVSESENAETLSGRPDPEELLESFIYCTESAENSMTCKYFIAKAICMYYRINDFETDEGTYINFEEILPRIKSSDKWYRAGDAINQDVLVKAQDAVNIGKAALAISDQEQYGHVVLILPGKTEAAPAWKNLSVPQVASFFMVPGIQPFVNRSMAFAWRAPEGIGIYIRK